MSILTDPGKAQATAYSPISMTSSLLINLFRRFANLAHTVCHNCDMIRFLWIWECLFWSGTMLTPSHQLIIVVKSSIIALPLGQLYKKMIWWPKKRTFFLTTSHGQTRIWQAKRLCNHPKCRSWSNKGGRAIATSGQMPKKCPLFRSVSEWRNWMVCSRHVKGDNADEHLNYEFWFQAISFLTGTM